MAKDTFHEQVKTALIKEGWTITHDPFSIAISEVVKLQIDLGAEGAIAAERESEKIAVEIKIFIGDSDISAFHSFSYRLGTIPELFPSTRRTRTRADAVSSYSP
jgi:hypothetical protein